MRSFFSSSRTENSSRPTGRSLPRAKADAIGAAAVKAKNPRREREWSGIIGKANDNTHHAEQTDAYQPRRRSSHLAGSSGSGVFRARSDEGAGLVGRVRLLRHHERLRAYGHSGTVRFSGDRRRVLRRDRSDSGPARPRGGVRHRVRDGGGDLQGTRREWLLYELDRPAEGRRLRVSRAGAGDGSGDHDRGIGRVVGGPGAEQVRSGGAGVKRKKGRGAALSQHETDSLPLAPVLRQHVGG